MDWRMLGWIAALTLGTASGAQADTTRCLVNLNGVQTVLEFDTRTTDYRSLWEGWSPLAPDCPSAAIIARLKPDVPLDQRRAYCVITEADTDAYLAVVNGPGDRFGRCRSEANVCRAVNSAKEYGVSTLKGVGGVLLGSTAALDEAGVIDAPRSTGARILTGVSGYFAGTFGMAGTTAVSIVSAPEVLIGAAAGAVVIGGAVLICRN